MDRDEAKYRWESVGDPRQRGDKMRQPEHMRHLDFIDDVARRDVSVVRTKEATYQGSWKRRGGVDTFMMLARKWDRIETMCEGSGYNILAKTAEEKYDDSDGTILAEVGDLRRYLLLVESECRKKQEGRPERTVLAQSSGPVTLGAGRTTVALEEPRGYDPEEELGPERETLLEETDDGTRITMDSYSGGGSQLGIWGRIVIRKTLRDGTTMTRTLEATEDWQLG